MILSNNLLLSDKQAITATAISTNVIDLGAPGTPFDAAAPLNHDTGKGTKVPLLVQVNQDFNNLTSLTVTIETGSTTALGTVVSQEVIPLASLTAGQQTAITYMPNKIQRYFGVRYTVTGTAPTTGQVTAGVVGGVQTNVTGA